MNRRGFLGTLFGLAVAPAVVVRVLSSPPKPKFEVYRGLQGGGLAGYTGHQFLESGYIHAPYIPLQITSTRIEAKSRKLNGEWKCELEQDLQCFHSTS